MIAVSRKAGLFAVTAALLLAGCGGGGSDGGTTPPPGGGNPPPTDGITRTGVAFAVGPIQDFGSVWVNGVEYHTDTAIFIRDDNPGAIQDDFDFGETVRIKGTIDDNGNATATEVEFEDVVEGPVDAASMNDVNRTFVVLGQTIQIVAGTVIDDNCQGGFAGLANYPQVEVSGAPNGDGVIEATRVECKSVIGANDLWEVNGIVTNLTATTFQINTLVVNYNDAMRRNFPNDRAIAEGDPVEAKTARPLGTNGEFLADVVEYKGVRFDDNTGDHMEIEGFITRFVSPTDFDVSGIPVKEITGTVYEGGSRGDLDLNLKVEVEGEFDTAGVLNATKIEIKDSTAVRVVGLLDSRTGSTLQVLGITINTDSVKTRFDDASSLRLDPLLVTNLARGDYVEIRGQELPAGQITAMEVRREYVADDPDIRDRTELRGFVEVGGLDETNRTLTVLGVLIRTADTTIYKDTNEAIIDATAFWAAVGEGSLVNAREDNQQPTLDSTVLNATELQLELE